MMVWSMVRRIDEVGRIALPKEIRRALNIQPNDPVEIWVDKNTNSVVLRPYSVERM